MGAEYEADEPFMIARTYIKFWPAEYHSQSAIDAALTLRRQIGDTSQIKSVDIYTFEASYNIIGKYAAAWAPKTRETADHSLPYCTAIALLDGEVTLRQFDPERFTAPEVLELLTKVKVHLDNALPCAIRGAFRTDSWLHSMMAEASRTKWSSRAVMPATRCRMPRLKRNSARWLSRLTAHKRPRRF